tara:strand:- start:5741 stop:6043 length:303 start_codon:yes stop_codon:yes gene_type:complete
MVKHKLDDNEILLFKLDSSFQIVTVVPFINNNELLNVKAIMNIAIKSEINYIVIVSKKNIDSVSFKKYRKAFLYLEIELKDFIFIDDDEYYSYHDNKFLK